VPEHHGRGLDTYHNHNNLIINYLNLII
jgi:hypothetical protein